MCSHDIQSLFYLCIKKKGSLVLLYQGKGKDTKFNNLDKVIRAISDIEFKTIMLKGSYYI